MDCGQGAHAQTRSPAMYESSATIRGKGIRYLSALGSRGISSYGPPGVSPFLARTLASLTAAPTGAFVPGR